MTAVLACCVCDLQFFFIEAGRLKTAARDMISCEERGVDSDASDLTRHPELDDAPEQKSQHC